MSFIYFDDMNSRTWYAKMTWCWCCYYVWIWVCLIWFWSFACICSHICLDKGFPNGLTCFQRNGPFYALLQRFYVHMFPYLVQVVVLPTFLMFLQICRFRLVRFFRAVCKKTWTFPQVVGESSKFKDGSNCSILVVWLMSKDTYSFLILETIVLSIYVTYCTCKGYTQTFVTLV